MGIIANVHFLEIADWFVSWLTLDLSGDDLVTHYARQRKAKEEVLQELGREPETKEPPGELTPPPAMRPPEPPPPPTTRLRDTSARPTKYRLEDLIP